MKFKANIAKQLLISMFSAIAVNAYAIVAPKTPIQYTQPDGTVITLQMHGDEFHHWVTSGGRVVQMDADGFYRPCATAASVTPDMLERRRQAAALWEKARAGSAISQGRKKFLVLLVEFSDLKFATEGANSLFDDLLNKDGYSHEGSKGSVHDYYFNNSNGKFDPDYDVVGPVTLDKSYKYYGGNNAGGNDTHPEEALYDACVKIDGDIDFSVYDNDRDGYVDNVFFFYAGYGEAQGGGDDTIWPHSWSLQYSSNYKVRANRFDGVKVGSYACASELMGYSGTSIDGIGTFCHEFGHVLGLPDFYDTDYSENGTAALTPDFYSLMSSGSYNDNSHRPPYLSYYERVMLGWADEHTVAAGEYVLRGVEHDDGYVLLTDNPGERFYIEYRDMTGWDLPLKSYIGYPQALLVYHLDQSQNKVSRYTAAALWGANMVNCFASHPCYRLIDDSTYYGKLGVSVNSVDFIPWSGIATGLFMDGISFSVDGLSVNFSISDGNAPEELEDLGFSYIYSPRSEYLAGHRFELILAETEGRKGGNVTWYYDGVLQKGQYVSLKTGTHVIRADVEYPDGSKEIIETEIVAK